MWHGSWTGAQQLEARTRWRDGNEEIWPPRRAPGHSHCHCHGNGEHQPSHLPGLLQHQPIPAHAGTSMLCQGIQAYRTSTSGTDPHFVRQYDHDSDRLVASQQARSASQRGRSQIGIVTGVARLVRSARLQTIRCDRRCASILRASLVDPAAETTNNHAHQRPRITNYGLESSNPTCKQCEF